MAKRNRKAIRGNGRNRQGRPQGPIAFAPPALDSADASRNDSLGGAILAAVESSAAASPADVALPPPPPVPRIDPLAATVVGHPIIAVRSVSQEDAAGAIVGEATEALDDPLRNSLDDFDAAFFAQPSADALRAGQESFPPIADDVLAEKKPLPPPPEVLARRSRLRKVVGAIVAMAAVLVVGGVAKTLVAGERPLSSLSASAVGKTVERSERAAAPGAVVTVAPGAAEAPVPAAAAVIEAAPIAENAPGELAAAPPMAPEEGAVPAGVDAKAEALRLLNAGKIKQAVPMSRAAIAADPSDALPYLYLGTALQELGKHKEAIEVYSDCVGTATKGRVWECRAMGGRKGN